MNEAIIDEMDEVPTYQKFQLVWAKILGWPWWPAKVTEIPSQKNGNYRVQFLADTSHAFLSYEKLINYQQGRDRHSTPKGHYRNFTKALALADKLLQTSSVLKDEARTYCSSRKKLPDQQIQIINQSQQVPNNSKQENQNKIQQQQDSNMSIQEPKAKLRSEICRKVHENKNKNVINQKSRQQVQQEVRQLLKKYKLDSDLYQSLKNIQLKSIKKRKIITKENECQKAKTSFQIQTKLARIICKILSSKNIKLEQRYNITTTLMNSLFVHKQKGVEGIHRALFQWIRCNDAEFILQNYKLWPIQTKCDHFTDCF